MRMWLLEEMFYLLSSVVSVLLTSFNFEQPLLVLVSVLVLNFFRKLFPQKMALQKHSIE